MIIDLKLCICLCIEISEYYQIANWILIYRALHFDRPRSHIYCSFIRRMRIRCLEAIMKNGIITRSDA
ncbi:Protein translocase subunit SecA [Dirofilaria immitis]